MKSFGVNWNYNEKSINKRKFLEMNDSLNFKNFIKMSDQFSPTFSFGMIFSPTISAFTYIMHAGAAFIICALAASTLVKHLVRKTWPGLLFCVLSTGFCSTFHFLHWTNLERVKFFISFKKWINQNTNKRFSIL